MDSLEYEERGLPSLIVLTGFRATGKTAVGRLLAKLLGYQFLDTDETITVRMNCSIAESVSRYGWQPFRAHERVLLEELAYRRKTVIATGGGAVLHQDVWRRLHERAVVVWLRTDLSTTLSRLRQDTNTAGQRPSLKNQDWKAETAALLTEREPLYRTGSDLSIETEDRTAEMLAEVVFRRITHRT